MKEQLFIEGRMAPKRVKGLLPGKNPSLVNVGKRTAGGSKASAGLVARYRIIPEDFELANGALPRAVVFTCNKYSSLGMVASIKMDGSRIRIVAISKASVRANFGRLLKRGEVAVLPKNKKVSRDLFETLFPKEASKYERRSSGAARAETLGEKLWEVRVEKASHRGFLDLSDRQPNQPPVETPRSVPPWKEKPGPMKRN